MRADTDTVRSTTGRAGPVTATGSARRALTVLGAALLLIATAAAAAFAAQTYDVAVVDDAFDPPTIEITEGDTVQWTQTGSNPHTVTSDDGSFDSHPECETFADAGDGNCMEEGDTYEHTFEEPGEYSYHCRIHGSPGAGMAGTVIVQAAEEEPADDNGEPTEEEPAEEEDDPVDEEDDPVEEEDEDELPHTGVTGILAVIAAAALVGGASLIRRTRGS